MENSGFEIYFNDLNENAQKRLLKYVGAKDASECNWDLDIIPLAIFLSENNENKA